MNSRSSKWTNRLAAALGLVFFLCIGAESASADMYYGATGSNGVNGSLYLINPATGGTTLIGPLLDSTGNHYSLTGLAFQPVTGVLYGSTSNNGVFNVGHLIRIDPATALVTDIGSFGLFNGKNQTTCADIKFDPTSGILYCSKAGGFTASADHWLYTVSLTTGAATKVGSGSRTENGGQGLAANSVGTFYATPDGNSIAPTLRTVDKTTGNEIVVGPLGTPQNFPVNALDFNSAGVLFGFLSDQGGVAHIQWVTINTSTGLLTVIGPTVDNADALAILKPAADFQVGYAANLGAGQSVVNLTNAGTNGGNDNTDYICANVYVFAQDQQLISCCACPMSPNDLQTLSVQNDLINNTLTPGVPTGVTIGLVATDDTGKGACNAATVDPIKFVHGLRAWGTKLHAAPGGGYAVTETAFSRVDLSASELAKMTSFCGFIQADGSKYGICNSCQPGAQGANRK